MILTAEKLSAAIEKSTVNKGTEDRRVNKDVLQTHIYRSILEATAQERLEEAVAAREELKPVVFALIRAAFHKGLEVGLEYEK